MQRAVIATGKIPEILVCALLAFLLAQCMRAYRPMPLADDSYQYLNVAENIRAGRGVATSLVHFDAERSHGKIPAPLTTFPPGYAVVLAIAGSAPNAEAVARIVSVVCYAGTAAMLAWALLLAGVTTFVRVVMLVLFATNAVGLQFSTAILTEPLYLLVSTGAVACLMWAEATHSVTGLMVGFVAAGLSYWIRYAGLFLIAALVAYALAKLVRERNRFRAAWIWSALIPAGMSGALMVRNWLTVGTWKGGNDMPVWNGLQHVTADYVRAQLHLILGQHPVIFGGWEGALATGLVMAVIGISAAGKRGSQASVQNSKSPAMLAGACTIVYSAGIFYAGLSTVISFGTRMFLPVLPLYLLLLGAGLDRILARWPSDSRWVGWLLRFGVVLASIGYVGANARDLYLPRPPERTVILSELFSKPGPDGQPLMKWVEASIAPEAVITATDGQATGYFLRRPTLSMIGREYSSVRWECDEVRSQMERFKSKYVIVYKPSGARNDGLLIDESSFVDAAISGEPPCGFAIATENSGIRILKRGGAD